MTSTHSGGETADAGGRPLTPFQIAVLYSAFGVVLLVVSDVLLPMWLSGPTLREIQGVKGLAEVLASAVLIYLLVASAHRQLRLKDRAMDEAPVGITIADARSEDHPLVYVNEGFEEMTGYDESDCLGGNCRFLQGPDTDPEPVAQLRAAIDAARPAEVDVRNYRKDGTPFWNRVSVVPVTDASGTVTHYLGLQRDVTASKARKQRLAVLNRVLRHNMRNKLNVIRGRAEQLTVTGDDCAGQGDLSSTDEAADARRAIRDAADELTAIAEQVRAFDTALDGDRHCHEVDVTALLADLTDAVRERHPDATIDFEGQPNAMATVNETFESAVESLLDLLADAEDPAVSVRVRDEGTAVIVEIRDRSGVLSSADLNVVARGTETPLVHALGLELWLVRWATEQSPGEFGVDVESEHPAVRLRLVGTAVDPA